MGSGGELAAFEVLAAPLFASLLETFHVSYDDFLRSVISGQLLGGTPIVCISCMFVRV